MAKIFIDTAHLLAVLIESDGLHEKATAEGDRLSRQQVEFVTTPLVLAELLAAVSRRGPWTRSRAVAFVERLRAEPSVTVWPLTPELFDDALALFKARPDQRYSLTDCASMVVSHRLNVTQILTADRDFENEGFEILL